MFGRVVRWPRWRFLHASRSKGGIWRTRRPRGACVPTQINHATLREKSGGRDCLMAAGVTKYLIKKYCYGSFLFFSFRTSSLPMVSLSLFQSIDAESALQSYYQKYLFASSANFSSGLSVDEGVQALDNKGSLRCKCKNAFAALTRRRGTFLHLVMQLLCSPQIFPFIFAVHHSNRRHFTSVV